MFERARARARSSITLKEPGSISVKLDSALFFYIPRSKLWGVTPWTLHVDLSSNAIGSRLGIVMKSPRGGKMVYSIRCDFQATNNEAECEALILELNMARDLGAMNRMLRLTPA